MYNKHCVKWDLGACTYVYKANRTDVIQNLIAVGNSDIDNLFLPLIFFTHDNAKWSSYNFAISSN